MKTYHLAASLLILLIPLLFCLSCQSSGTPPAAPAELPSSFPFPTTIGINVDKILAEGESDVSSTLFTVAPGGEFSDEISIGARMADEVIEELDAVLEIFGDVDVPIGETTVNVETTVTDNDGEGREIKIDFASYDLDGNGTNEGCSGHTATLPICFRIWLDGDRFMAGLFDVYPSDENPGAGEFRLVDLLNTGTGGFDFEDSEKAAMGAVYDHGETEDKSTDLSSITPSSVETEYRHISLAEVGPASSSKKTLNMAGQQMGTVSYLGQWIEDEDFWSGRITIEEEGVSDEIIPCAQISTGNGVDAALCEALGITVTDLQFNELPTEDDVSLPEDFPAEPTF